MESKKEKLEKKPAAAKKEKKPAAEKEDLLLKFDKKVISGNKYIILGHSFKQGACYVKDENNKQQLLRFKDGILVTNNQNYIIQILKDPRYKKMVTFKKIHDLPKKIEDMSKEDLIEYAKSKKANIQRKNPSIHTLRRLVKLVLRKS